MIELRLNTKWSIPFCRKLSPLSKTWRPFLLVNLFVRGTTAAASDVGIMSTLALKGLRIYSFSRPSNLLITCNNSATHLNIISML